MTRTDVTTAINARVVPIVEYDADPRGWSMFRALAGRFQRAIRGTEGTIVTKQQAEFTGYALPPQQFTGMAPLGTSRLVVGRGTDLSDERSTALDDSAMRIFAERLRRGK